MDSEGTSAPESILGTENWLDWNKALDNPNDSEDDREANNKSAIVLDTCVIDSEAQGQQIVSAAPNVPRLIQPTQRLK